MKLNPSNIAKVQAAMKSELKKDGQSMCEAIRKVAKRLGSVRRIEIEAALTGAPFKMNVGTVRRQIQEGRAK